MPISFPRRQNRAPIPAVGVQQMLARAPAGGHSEMRAALARLGEAYSAVHDTTARHQTDATVTPAARMVRSARAARAALTPALEALNKARASASDGRAHLQRQMAKPFEYSAFADVMIAAEIRGHFASLPDGQRHASLLLAVEAGDETTLKALGTAPAYLAGLPPALHARARDSLIDLHPEARASRDAAKAFEEQAEFATLIETTVLQATADLIDFVEADSFAAAAQDAVAA